VITLNLKWFVGLSVAAHAAALVAWQDPALHPGYSGRTLLVSVTQHTGSPASVPVETTRPETPRPPARPVTPDRQPARAASVAAHTAAVASSRAATTEPARVAAATPAARPANTASREPVHPQDTDRHLRDSIMQLITQALTYPAIARRKGWQGVVTLQLHIEADGSISALQLDETSGYAVLDTAAIECLHRASVPNAAQWLQGQAADIIVPVEYRLTGS